MKSRHAWDTRVHRRAERIQAEAAQALSRPQAGPRWSDQITVVSLIDVGCKHGLFVTYTRIRDAVRDGALKPATSHPLTFTTTEANRWLSLLRDQSHGDSR